MAVMPAHMSLAGDLAAMLDPGQFLNRQGVKFGAEQNSRSRFRALVDDGDAMAAQRAYAETIEQGLDRLSADLRVRICDPAAGWNSERIRDPAADPDAERIRDAAAGQTSE